LAEQVTAHKSRMVSSIGWREPTIYTVLVQRAGEGTKLEWLVRMSV
jgi:hypothetical protein